MQMKAFAFLMRLQEKRPGGALVLKKILVSCTLILLVVFNIFAFPLTVKAEVYDAVAVAKIIEKTDVFQLKAKGAVLMDSNSGAVLLESNSHEKLPIASVTKVMSMLLIMEAIDSGKIKFEDLVPISPYVTNFGGSQLWLDVRESRKYTVAEILKGIAIHSANDGTVAMAEMIAGSEKAFVEMMNAKARELGMNDTNFLDCTGLTDDGHYSSANDVAVMSRELITKHPKILEFTSIRRDVFGEGKRAKPTDLDNTNQLIGRYSGMIGLKTGYTKKAGHNLSGVAKRNNMQLIAVVLGEPDGSTRFAEVQTLLDYGFSNYEIQSVNKQGEEVGAIEVKKGLKTTVKAIYGHDVNLLLKKGEKGKVVREPKYEASLTAPLQEGQVVGHMLYMVDGREVGRAEIVLESSVERASLFKIFSKMMAQWFGLGRS